MTLTALSIGVLSLQLATATKADAADANWPRWRGPQQNGHWHGSDTPTRWNADSVIWKCELPGEGQSSPVTWGNRIFLTSALEDGRQRVVLAVDRRTGQIEWQQIAWEGAPEPSHNENGWASATCATDGERVYAFFGRGGLHCYTVDGHKVWSKGLGSFEGPWGTAACPLLVENLVIQNCDADRDAAIIAFVKRSGEELWRTDRPDYRGWSTPVLIQASGRDELVLNGHTGVTAYDPATGRERWFCKSFNGRGSPTVTPHDGLLLVLNGLRGDAYAIRPGGNGDVTRSHMAWHTRRTSGRDLSSPIVVNGVSLVMSLRPEAILTGYEAATGRQLFMHRVGGKIWSSPVAWSDRAFVLRGNGEAVVLDPKAVDPVVAVNSLDAPDDEIFRASITPAPGRVYIRSNTALYCVGRSETASE